MHKDRVRLQGSRHWGIFVSCIKVLCDFVDRKEHARISRCSSCDARREALIEAPNPALGIQFLQKCKASEADYAGFAINIRYQKCRSSVVVTMYMS